MLNIHLPKRLLPIIIVLIVFGVAGWFYQKRANNLSTTVGSDELAVFNTNISQGLKNIPNNTVIFLGLKNSFVLPDGYKVDSQIIDRSMLIYPRDQKNINYSGTSSLESFKGIFITSANTVTSEEMFNEMNQAKFASFKEVNPESDAVGQIKKDAKGNDMFVITQTKPYKMIETLLNRGLIVEIVSYEETDAYRQIRDTYSDQELISNADHKAIYQLQQDLITAYESQEPQKVFSLLSNAAQKNNSLEKIKLGMASNIFQDMISIEPTALICINQNYIMQSRVLFRENIMKRVDLTFWVEYDGERNNWSIDSYSIKNKEQYLSKVETQ